MFIDVSGHDLFIGMKKDMDRVFEGAKTNGVTRKRGSSRFFERRDDPSTDGRILGFRRGIYPERLRRTKKQRKKPW
jgi:hypothetical protein